MSHTRLRRCGLMLSLVMFLAATMGMLTACSTMSSSSRTSSPPAAETDHESCVRACNQDYARCGDTGAARRETGNSSEMFGAEASCRRDLRACLPSCRGR